MVAAKSTRNAARKAAPRTTPSPDVIQQHLRIVAVELRCALAAVTVAAHALREQNAEIDADAATVLRRGAGAPLHTCLERIETLLGAFSTPGSGNSSPECVH